jgi:hypothetical protein
VLGGGLALGLVGSSCGPLIQHIETVTTSEPPEDLSPDATFVRKFTSQYGPNAYVYRVFIRDPDGYFTGRVALQRQQGAGAAATVLAAYRTAKIAGTISVSTDAVIHIKALAVVSAKAGSYCLSMSGKTDLRYPNQLLRGQFSVVGGSGSAARLHASGPLLGIEPKAKYDPNKPGPLTILVASKKASLGARRGLTAACRAAAKPPPPPTKISASLDGFAFAPAGATTLPSGTTIYPNNSTISGNVGCGNDNNLYLVVSYQGPKGSTFYLSYVTDTGGKGGPPPTALKQGQNAIPLAAAPANGTYNLAQAAVVPPPGTPGATGFTGSITLARTC